MANITQQHRDHAMKKMLAYAEKIIGKKIDDVGEFGPEPETVRKLFYLYSSCRMPKSSDMHNLSTMPNKDFAWHMEYSYHRLALALIAEECYKQFCNIIRQSKVVNLKQCARNAVNNKLSEEEIRDFLV